jgi:uncharacterized protein YbaA (DUF1428 family)
MSYIDGFVIPVAHGDKDRFIEHARRLDVIFLEYGALRIVEGWGDDVPAGKHTDFARSVAATEGENVAFSWIEWPDKATRDAGMARIQTDERMMAEPAPFDGKRMIFGGFEPVVDLRPGDQP